MARGGQPASRRLRREERTITAMVRLYCRDHHGGCERNAESLCAGCAGLLDYARARLAHCPYGGDKPTCAQCPRHCYRPDRREQVRVVMRYSGPRMLRRHPLLALAHLWDGWRGGRRGRSSR